MLELNIGGTEYYDEDKNEFVIKGSTPIQLEHSLASLSKWESEWEKPFLTDSEKSTEETMSYIRAMLLTPNVPDSLLNALTVEDGNRISEYIGSKMTATWFKEDKNQKKSREVITAEIIYHWMIALQIPMECERWHLGRLLTLIRVVDQKNSTGKKMSKAELSDRHRELNAQRRAQYNTRG